MPNYKEDEMEGYQHYIRTNEAGIIIYGFSSAFEQPLETDYLFAEEAPRHFHESFKEPLTNERGQYRYKLIGSELVVRAQLELDEEYENNKPPIVKTEEQKKIEQIELLIFKPDPDKLFKSLVIENIELDDLKNKKIEQLDYLCNVAILGGFTSNCLGNDHYYTFDYESQMNFSGSLNAFTAGILNDSIVWKTDQGNKLHTLEQFKQLFTDGLVHKQSTITKYWVLKEQVLSLELKQDVLLIEW
jgi:hypothetical protein